MNSCIANPERRRRRHFPPIGPRRWDRGGTWTAALFLAAGLIFSGQAAPDDSRALIERLKQTHAVNLDSVLEGQRAQTGASAAPGFRVPDPYANELTPSRADQDGVCALRFLGPERTGYELSDFESAAAAREAGFQVTHFGRCGACSTLEDLAVYLARPDLTSPARRCARRWGARRIRQCFTEDVGLTPACAESWTHNALNTRKACREACVETYGLLNLLLHRYPAPDNRPDGSLNACLQCDEDVSGPGFRFSAGRTRRNSGIVSSIERPAGDVREVDHARYFDSMANDPLPDR